MTVDRLANESSPYLQQYASNPVEWYPWGDEAPGLAVERDWPIFLSIRYSACHWCHVMEHECLSNSDIAAVMNQNFINIKIDREERRDLDQIYMSSVMALTGCGGGHYPRMTRCVPLLACPAVHFGSRFITAGQASSDGTRRMPPEMT